MTSTTVITGLCLLLLAALETSLARTKPDNYPMNSMERWDPRVALARYRHEKRAPRWRQAVVQDDLDFDVMPISAESRQPSVKLFFFDRKNRTSFRAIN